MRLWGWIMGIGTIVAVGALGLFSGWFDRFLSSDERDKSTTEITAEDRIAFHESCRVEPGAVLDVDTLDAFLASEGLEDIVANGVVSEDDHTANHFILGAVTPSTATLSQACSRKNDVDTLRHDLASMLNSAEAFANKTDSLTSRDNAFVELARQLRGAKRQFDQHLSAEESGGTYRSPILDHDDEYLITSIVPEIYQIIDQYMGPTQFEPKSQGFEQLLTSIESSSDAWREKRSASARQLRGSLDRSDEEATFFRSLDPIIGRESSSGKQVEPTVFSLVR